MCPSTEAFYKRLPVVAYAATAVPATMDGAGVLYEDRAPVHVAAIIDAVLDDAALYERIVASQDAALARLRGRDFGGTLLRFVEQALCRPRRGSAEVSFDFWDQFETYERLKELQQYRAGDLPGPAVSTFGARSEGVSAGARQCRTRGPAGLDAGGAVAFALRIPH